MKTRLLITTDDVKRLAHISEHDDHGERYKPGSDHEWHLREEGPDAQGLILPACRRAAHSGQGVQWAKEWPEGAKVCVPCRKIARTEEIKAAVGRLLEAVDACPPDFESRDCSKTCTQCWADAYGLVDCLEVE